MFICQYVVREQVHGRSFHLKALPFQYVQPEAAQCDRFGRSTRDEAKELKFGCRTTGKMAIAMLDDGIPDVLLRHLFVFCDGSQRVLRFRRPERAARTFSRYLAPTSFVFGNRLVVAFSVTVSSGGRILTGPLLAWCIAMRLTEAGESRIITLAWLLPLEEAVQVVFWEEIAGRHRLVEGRVASSPCMDARRSHCDGGSPAVGLEFLRPTAWTGRTPLCVT